MASFEIGKSYKPVYPDSFFSADSWLSLIGESFVCHAIDESGDCWSMDVTFKGDTCMDGEGWCTASPEDLEDGRVIAI
nr:hypothetical protein [Pseudomonas sp. P818]